MTVGALLKVADVLEDRAVHHESLGSMASKNGLPRIARGCSRAALEHREFLWSTVGQVQARIASEH
jgi:hypothetical protein